MVLADTSVWVDYLRAGTRGGAASLDGLLSTRQVVMCGPVAAEILTGTREDQRATLWHLLSALPWIDLRRPDWLRVGELAAQLLEIGGSVAMTDLHIAVAAIASDAQLWSRDTDFDRIAEVAEDLARFPG